MVKFTEHKCTKCAYNLYDRVYNYSFEHYGFGLCKNCQKWFKQDDPIVTRHSKRLFLTLCHRGVNVEIEKDDGHKHIDLAITGKDLKLNIEIDGSQHYTCSTQSFRDLQRNYHSMLEGFYTIHLPNVLIAEKLEETADTIVELLKHFRNNPRNRPTNKNLNQPERLA